MAHAVSGLWEVIRNYYRGDTGNDDEGVEEDTAVRGVKKRKKAKTSKSKKGSCHQAPPKGDGNDRPGGGNGGSGGGRGGGGSLGISIV